MILNYNLVRSRYVPVLKTNNLRHLLESSRKKSGLKNGSQTSLDRFVDNYTTTTFPSYDLSVGRYITYTVKMDLGL